MNKVYRVIEDLDAPEEERYQVQSSIYGHTWGTHAKYPDQISAEIQMEKLAKGPRVIAEAEGEGG